MIVRQKLSEMSLKELQQLEEAHRTHQRQEALQRPAAGETMADIACGLPAAPFINVLSALQLKSKTDDWDLPTPRATALFSYYVI